VSPLPFEVPTGLAGQAAISDAWASWLGRLPRLLRDLLDDWELSVDGAPLHGFASIVVPVLTPDGARAALKVTFDGDDESLHEGLALQNWHGNGTVLLLMADPHRRALLLERLHTEDLGGVDDLEACEIVAGFYPLLHVAALPQLRTVTSYVETWLADLAAQARNGPIPRRFVEQALSLGRDLVTDPASTGRIVHGDLHQHNVLAADRTPWLVIDPKPMSGDPHYELEPMLRNRWDEVLASGDVRAAVRRRFHTIVDAAGLDEARARDWTIVRLVVNAGWAIQDASTAGRGLDAEDQEWITRCVTIAKAVQD
jgi:streptomycin 6-kinase